MSDKKDKKIANGNFSLFPKNADKFPKEFTTEDDKFINKWVDIVRKSMSPEGQDVSKPVPGIVLKVVKNGKVSPGGPRSRINKISSIPNTSCVKIWVHAQFDDGLSVPNNNMPPEQREQLIGCHYVYEPAPGYETEIPSPGDFVSVIHPWAWGFTNKVGLYQGIITQGFPTSIKKVSSNFKNKKAARSKTIPE